MNVFSALAAVIIAITTVQHPTLLRAGTRIQCVLGTTVDSSTARSGDEFILRVADDAHPSLYGAVIQGHITHVRQARGILPAEIAFWFDDITFLDRTREPIRAYVIAPNVTQRVAVPPQAAVPPPGPPRLPNTQSGPPARSTIVWQTQIGTRAGQTAQTGGVAYAAKTGVPLVARQGMLVTIELASDLTTP
ncbi:MAG TPA: hypothetical protein VMF11_07480 [Candidatus Baltobacteraceae bacterium]|nr:hypothetical protein [Candidatus Baltobacteraceae bacterium]